MLEQFRALHAALRLREFTSKSLAEESGVAFDTVQKILRRRTDLFKVAQGKASGGRGRTPKLYRINEEFARSALNQAAQEIEIPAVPTAPNGDGLGIELLRYTLLHQLPNGDIDERAHLIAAAREQLSLDSPISSRAEYQELRELFQQLEVLVGVERWLVEQVAQVFSVDLVSPLVVAIEAVVSQNEREARTNNPERMERSVSAIAGFPREGARLQSALQRSAGVIPAPSPSWWLDAPAALWSLLRNSSWRFLVGDLLQGDLLLHVNAQQVSEQDHPEVEATRDEELAKTELPNAIADEPQSRPTKRKRKRVSEPDAFLRIAQARAAIAKRFKERHKVFDMPRNRILRLGTSLPGSFGEHYAGILRPAHGMDWSRYGAARGSLTIRFDPDRQLPIRSQSRTSISELEFEMGTFRAVSATLSGESDGDMKVPFGSLRWNQDHFENDSILRAEMPVVGMGHRATTILGSESARARATWVLSGRDEIRIILDRGSEIAVVDVADTSSSEQIIFGRESRAGAIDWIDVQAQTGAVERFHMLRADAQRLVIPPSDLNYDANRNCFLLRPQGSGKPEEQYVIPAHIAAAIQRQNQKRDDLGLRSLQRVE